MNSDRRHKKSTRQAASRHNACPAWLDWARRIQAIGQTGETYTTDAYDLERYQQLRELAVEIMATYTGELPSKIRELFASEAGYQTPKVDIRAAVFRDNTILLVQEAMDGRWALPGGWADVQVSPAENAIKEVLEESGYKVRPLRLLAVWDRRCHDHPPIAWHIYKLVFECEIIAGEEKTGLETMAAKFFGLDSLPSLSTTRTTEQQLRRLFELQANPDSQPEFD